MESTSKYSYKSAESSPEIQKAKVKTPAVSRKASANVVSLSVAMSAKKLGEAMVSESQDDTLIRGSLYNKSNYQKKNSFIDHQDMAKDTGIN